MVRVDVANPSATQDDNSATSCEAYDERASGSRRLRAAGSGAIAGILSDTMQSTVANAADNVGLGLPRPDIRLDVDGAGEIVFEMVDGVLTVVGIEGNAQWDAQIRSQTDTSAVVDFVSETQTKTVTLATNTVGEVETMIETASNSELKTELGADTSADAGIESGSNSNGANTDRNDSCEG